MEKAILKRVQSWKCTLFYGNINGTKMKEIEGFAFYNEKGIIVEYSRSYLEKEIIKTSKNGKTYKSKDIIDNIELSQLRNARVENFSKKDNFVIKGIVYLYCGENGDISFIEKFSSEKDFDTSIHEYENYKFMINNTQEVFVIEKFIKSKKTNKGEQIDNVCKVLQEKRIKVDTFVIKQLLENNLLDLTKF